MVGGGCGEPHWKHPVPGKGHICVSGYTFTAIKMGCVVLSVTVKLGYIKEVGASWGYFNITLYNLASVPTQDGPHRHSGVHGKSTCP